MKNYLRLILSISFILSLSVKAEEYFRVSKKYEDVLLTPMNLDLVPLFKSKPKKNCEYCQTLPILSDILEADSIEINRYRDEFQVTVPTGESFVFERMSNEFGYKSYEFDKLTNGKYFLKLLNYHNLKVISIYKKKFFSSEYRFIGLFGFHTTPSFQGN